MARKNAIIPSQTPQSERLKWPPLSPGVDTSYPTLENLDAQKEWEARIAAGRIIVRQG